MPTAVLKHADGTVRECTVSGLWPKIIVPVERDLTVTPEQHHRMMSMHWSERAAREARTYGRRLFVRTTRIDNDRAEYAEESYTPGRDFFDDLEGDAQ